MARTRSSVAAKVSVGKSSKVRCSPAPASSSSSTVGASGGDRSSRSSTGGNPVCPRETPKWQKPITGFLKQHQAARADDNEDIAQAGSSKSKPKRNVIDTDDEEEQTSEKRSTNDQSDTLTDEQINKELDETIELGPLTGEDSHKIDEYYCTKNKGNGKKSNKYKTVVDNGNTGEGTDKENEIISDTKHMGEDNVNGQDKENIHMDNKDVLEIDKNDLDKEKIDTDTQIEVVDNEDIVKGNIDKENVNRIENKEVTNINDLDKEKIDNKENGDINSTRNKRHLDELNLEDERHSKKIKVD